MATELAEKPNRHERMQYLKSKVLYARGSSDKNDAGKSYKMVLIKDSPEASHFIFEINVRKRRIRHTTTLELNDGFPARLKID